MTTTVVSVAAFALLFGIAGLLRPQEGACGDSCDQCNGPCPLAKGKDHA
jgi:hypothetical protein